MTEAKALSDAHVLYYRPMVEKAAGVSHRSAFYISRDDFEQLLWEWLLSYGHRYFLERSEREVLAGKEALSMSQKEALLIRKANSIAVQELMDYREFQGNYLYQYNEVKQLVCDEFGTDSMDIESRVDVREAFKALEAGYPRAAEAILKYYVHETEKTSAVAKAASRGLRRLCHLMNDSVKRTQVLLEEL